MFIYMNFSFDFLGLDNVNFLLVTSPMNSSDGSFFKPFFKNSLIIQEQNTKKNHKRVVLLYVIKNHVNLHKR
jgi:hypothetical protein